MTVKEQVRLFLRLTMHTDGYHVRKTFGIIVSVLWQYTKKSGAIRP